LMYSTKDSSIMRDRKRQSLAASRAGICGSTPTLAAFVRFSGTQDTSERGF